MSTASSFTTRKRMGKPSFVAAILLFAILGLLFAKSFIPDYVHFSNDGPLGQQNTEWSKLPGSIWGTWDDLNSIGVNAGSFPPSVVTLIRWLLGAVGYAKFLVPVALFILGIGAWTFFRQLKLSPQAAALGALATILNSVFFSDACWGLGSHSIAFGMDFLALALVVANSPTTLWQIRLTRIVLAGFAVGINVVEAADIGAIFSLLIAVFVLFRSFTENGSIPRKVSRGIGQIIVIAFFAGFIAWQTIVSLVGTQISGIVGAQQDEATKAARWGFATQWSFPKVETLGIVVPGLFGYRMDTPDGGSYWGAVGRDLAWDRFFAKQGPQPDPQQQFLRFSGTGSYAGILVLLVAAWTIAQLFRGKNSIFSETHRKFLWFWTVVLIASLLFSYGRFAPFYALLYQLPYFSTIRNPNKFLFVFSWALGIIFTYGIHGLSQRYLQPFSGNSIAPVAQLKAWWTKVRGFDRNWILGCIAVFVVSLVAWLIYYLQKPALIAYLQTVGFPDKDMAGQIAIFSVTQIGWFVLFFALAAGLFAFILSGAFTGRRALWAGIFLGVLLVVDLGRANLPWIVYWDYKQKYDIDPNNSANSTNPLINFLRDKPYEHRVAVLQGQSPFNALYNIEWAQHHFPYYNIQSLDKIQMPRMPADLEAYESALSPNAAPDSVYLFARHWQLTNTRYLLGLAGYLSSLNEQLDPVRHRFSIIKRFAVGLKPGVTEFHQRTDELTAYPGDDGQYALFDFAGALPRAKLYSRWQIAQVDTNTLQPWIKSVQQSVPKEWGVALAQQNTNDLATLYTLASANFDPEQTVLVTTNFSMTSAANTTNANSGTVEFKSYAPKDIIFDAQAAAPSILLLNDKYDPNWHVTVDGKPAELLRCNFIMRGVYLTPGNHTVEFQFRVPNGPLYVSLAAIGVGILLCGFLFFSTRRK
ncbi:MAG TPA: hypothetical protein VHG89_11575 [Verrucomicrobiae bacterium]|nr:hypothetical protein [Verrucomicrobiae bacterium]